MKRIFIYVIVSIAMILPSSCGMTNLIHFNLNDIHSNAVHKQFNLARKKNQLELMHRLARQAEEAYYASETLDDLYALRQDVNTLLLKYVQTMNKQSMGEVEHQLNSLNVKIDRSIREAEGDNFGTRGVNTYSVFGQETY